MVCGLPQNISCRFICIYRMANLRAALLMLLVVFVVNASETHQEQEHTIPKPSNDALPVVEPQENQRTKRQYFSEWTANAIVRVPVPQSYSIWQPQYYQIRRPYFIPIFGSSGRIPLYFPPQPLYINSGYPIDNPPKNYPGLPYLPPDQPQTEPPGNDTTTKETDTKYGEGGPVWDQVPARTSSTTVMPTRHTRKPGQLTTTVPPLVHKDEKTTALPDTAEKSAFVPIGPSNPSGGSGRPRPPGPQPPKELPGSPAEPSRCVWAIISCCSATSEHVNYSCFEQLGCTGAFWDTAPCESEFARSAIASAMNYYHTK